MRLNQSLQKGHYELGLSYRELNQLDDARISFDQASILNNNDIKFIDLQGFLTDTYLANPEISLFHDDIHPSLHGYKVIAEYLSIKITEIKV